MKLHVKRTDIFSIFVSVILFFNFPRFAMFNTVKYGMLLILGIYIFRYLKICFSKEFFSTNVVAFLFVFILLYASYINRSPLIQRDPFLAAIVFGVSVLECLLYMQIQAYYGQVQEVLRVLKYSIFILLIIVDFLLFLTPNGNCVNGLYLIGTKFNVSYLHLVLIAVYLISNKRYSTSSSIRMRTVLLSILSFVVSIKVDCMTGAIASVLFLFIILLISRNIKLMYSPIFYISVLVLTFVFAFVCDTVLMNENIATFINEFLDRNDTMTSRNRIFSVVIELLDSHWLFGYGYGTSYEWGRLNGGFANTQNGFLEWVWQCGIVGTLAMLLMLYRLVEIANKSSSIEVKEANIPVLSLLYVFTIISIIEISLSLTFFGTAVLVYAVSLNHKKDYLKGTCMKFRSRERENDYI